MPKLRVVSDNVATDDILTAAFDLAECIIKFIPEGLSTRITHTALAMVLGTGVAQVPIEARENEVDTLTDLIWTFAYPEEDDNADPT